MSVYMVKDCTIGIRPAYGAGEFYPLANGTTVEVDHGDNIESSFVLGKAWEVAEKTGYSLAVNFEGFVTGDTEAQGVIDSVKWGVGDAAKADLQVTFPWDESIELVGAVIEVTSAEGGSPPSLAVIGFTAHPGMGINDVINFGE